MWWFLGLLGLIPVSWGIVSARRVLYPERHLLSPPDPLPSYSQHVVSAPDGLPFDVWVLETSSPRARLLLCHGYYANRYQLLALAQGLRGRGCEVLLFELRGHGSRAGPCTLGMKETEDAQAILQWTRARDRTHALPVGVLGFSMGAAVACQLAFRDPTVRAVAVDSVYSRLFPVLQRAIRQRYHLPAFPWTWLTWWSVQLALRKRLAPMDPVALAPRLHQPLFCIQGGEDRRVIPILGREFYQEWAGPKEQWFEPNIAHVGMFAAHPEEYCNRVADFFRRVLAG